MFERFTDRARKVMALANLEAQRLNHEYIGTEHILLAMAKEGTGFGANVLRNGINLSRIPVEVEKLAKPGPEMVTMGKLPQTPRAKKVIEYAIEEAQNLNHNYVGTEHLLLGLLREHDGVAAQVLLNLGIRLEDAREEVLNLVGERDSNAPTWPHHNTLQVQTLMTSVETKVRETFKHPGIELLHVLHEVLNTSGVGTLILKELGLTQELVYKKIVECKPIGDSTPPQTIPSLDTQQFLEVILPAVAKKLGDKEINIDHIVLAFAEVTKGPMFDLFGEYSISQEKIHDEILLRLNKRMITPRPPESTQAFMITLGDAQASLKEAVAKAEEVFTEPSGTQLGIAEIVSRQLKLQIEIAKAILAFHGKVVSLEIPGQNRPRT